MSSNPVPSAPTTESDWNYTTRTTRIDAAPAWVWSVVSDPDRRAEWGSDCTSAVPQADDTVLLTRPNGQTATQRLTSEVAGRQIGWEQAAAGGRIVRRLSIAIDADGSGARVRIRQGWPQPRSSGPARAAMRWIARQQLRQQGAKIASAVEAAA